MIPAYLLLLLPGDVLGIAGAGSVAPEAPATDGFVLFTVRTKPAHFRVDTKPAHFVTRTKPAHFVVKEP